MKKFLTLLIIAIQFGGIAQEANDILSKVVTAPIRKYLLKIFKHH